MDLLGLLCRLEEVDGLQGLTIQQMLSFLTQASALKRDIAQPQPVDSPSAGTPEVLPPSVVEFLSESIGLSISISKVTYHLEYLGSLAGPGHSGDRSIFCAQHSQDCQHGRPSWPDMPDMPDGPDQGQMGQILQISYKVRLHHPHFCVLICRY